ncbi:MAG: NAD-binding protein [Bacteroidetes bacterium]|nr:NAD-binding protein [Bacteroidota bacterium]
MEQKIKKTRIYRIPIILGGIALVSGIFGFILEKFGWPGFLDNLRSSAPVQGLFNDLAKIEQSIYQAFQLSQFEYDTDKFGSAIQNPLLWFSRWLFPLALVWAVVSAYFRLWKNESKMKSIKKWKDHTIVCGYGEIGKRVVKNLVDNDKQVVVIDPTIETDHFYTDDQTHCILIRQDANIDTSLIRAGIHEARDLITVTGNDLKNFSILSNAKILVKNSNPKKVLRAFAHVDNFEIIDNVQEYSLFQITENNFDGRIFNADEIAARLVFKKYAPDIFVPVRDVNAPPLHILIIGFNKFAQSLVTMMGRSAHFLHDKKTQLTVIDQNMDQLKVHYLDRYENINEVIELELINCKSKVLTREIINTFKNKVPISVIYLCHEDVILQTMTLNRIKSIYNNDVNTVICKPDNVPVPEWVKPENKYHIYDPFTDACNYNNIIEEEIERLAEKFHNRWFMEERKRFKEKMKKYEEKRGKGEEIEKPQPKSCMTEWNQLSEECKQSNRSLAAHIDVKLRAIGCEKCDMNDLRPESPFPNNKTLIDQLANMEHRRWNADRFLSGWKYGKRNDKMKIHDNLVSWAELGDIQQYDIDAINEIPIILKSEEFKMKICKLEG